MTIKERYNRAIESFADKLRPDPNIIAVIAYGSVVHGNPWEKSDIDCMVVVRDQKLTHKSYGMYEDDILINVDLCQRSELKRGMEKEFGGSWSHSIDATSKIIYTKDESLYEYFEECGKIGESDSDKSIFEYVNWLLGYMEKVEKWLVVKNDPRYSRYFLLKAADPLSKIELSARRIPSTRESILQAMELNPSLMNRFYTTPMTKDLGADEIIDMLKELKAYILGHVDALIRVANEFFGDGEIKTGTQISSHFGPAIHFMHSVLDFLCDYGYLAKVSQTIRLTPKGRLCAEEIAFVLNQ